MSKILITGGSGLLGLNLAVYFRARHQVTLGLHNTQAQLAGVDVIQIPSSADGLTQVISKSAYDVVIHTAGLTDVDACEIEPLKATEINANLSRDVAISCQSAGVKLVHISTDHLFDGSKAMSDEKSTPIPLNQYAKTKLQAEQYVADACPEVLIIRTNFFGWGQSKKHSFSDWIIQSLKNSKIINLFDDVFFTPVLISVLAESIEKLLEFKASGIFNISSNERISKYEFGLKLCKTFGYDQQLINQTSVESLNLKAKRPSDMSLDNRKVVITTSSIIPTLDEQVIMLKSQLESGWADEIRNSLMES
jgi:dTDP-4-dehydrorhamnose reductase